MLKQIMVLRPCVGHGLSLGVFDEPRVMLDIQQRSKEPKYQPQLWVQNRMLILGTFGSNVQPPMFEANLYQELQLSHHQLVAPLQMMEFLGGLLGGVDSVEGALDCAFAFFSEPAESPALLFDLRTNSLSCGAVSISRLGYCFKTQRSYLTRPFSVAVSKCSFCFACLLLRSGFSIGLLFFWWF